jgi:hypothetical protein
VDVVDDLPKPPQPKESTDKGWDPQMPSSTTSSAISKVPREIKHGKVGGKIRDRSRRRTLRSSLGSRRSGREYNARYLGLLAHYELEPAVIGKAFGFHVTMSDLIQVDPWRKAILTIARYVLRRRARVQQFPLPKLSTVTTP